MAVLPDGTCECGVAAIILAKGSSGPEFREIHGGKRQILDTSEKKYNSELKLQPIEHTDIPSCCEGGHQYGNKNIIQFRAGDDGIVSESLRPQKMPRVIYDHSRVVIREVPTQPASQAGPATSSSSCCDHNTVQETSVDNSCCSGHIDCEDLIQKPSSASTSGSSSSTSISSLSSLPEMKKRRPVKLRSIVVKSDVNSPAIVRPLEVDLHDQAPSTQPYHSGDANNVTQQQIGQNSDNMDSTAESLDNDADYSSSGPTVALDQALYSLESYLTTAQGDSNFRQDYNLQQQMLSQHETQPSIYSGNTIVQQQPFTLTPSQFEALTRYSSRTGVLSYPTAGHGSASANLVHMPTQNFDVPSGININTSQSDLSRHLEILQLQHHAAESSQRAQLETMASSTGAEEYNGEGMELLDNLYSIYLTAACAVPGGDCLCTDNCTCAGCTKHGNLLTDHEGNGLEDLDILSWSAQNGYN
ncbi:hypothetical protein V1517DRAFT_338625 [Lipomyces orientalis]|uniref:Uncharacterized protein n=1 Tax=Lipomyces orientalis TaxID=1233043 RepID=A0ACC3TN80_9ASCO